MAPKRADPAAVATASAEAHVPRDRFLLRVRHSLVTVPGTACCVRPR